MIQRCISSRMGNKENNRMELQLCDHRRGLEGSNICSLPPQNKTKKQVKRLFKRPSHKAATYCCTKEI